MEFLVKKLMKRLLSISACITTLFAFNSCSTQMYVSNAVNAPALKEKGEVQLTVTQNDLQAAAALGRNFAIMANGYFTKYNGDNNYVHGGLLGEAGIGYYKMISPRTTFETFVGLGGARIYKEEQFIDQNDRITLGRFDANATKLFIQPDLGYRNKYFDAIISSRFSFVKYTRFTSENYPANELAEDYLDNNNLTGPLFMFAEPALTLRLGYKFIKVQAQWGLTVNMTSNRIRHANNFSSLGLVINIAKWYNNPDGLPSGVE